MNDWTRSARENRRWGRRRPRAGRDAAVRSLAPRLRRGQKHHVRCASARDRCPCERGRRRMCAPRKRQGTTHPHPSPRPRLSLNRGSGCSFRAKSLPGPTEVCARIYVACGRSWPHVDSSPSSRLFVAANHANSLPVVFSFQVFLPSVPRTYGALISKNGSGTSLLH